MASKVWTPAGAFAKALRSFQTGGITHEDFLEQIEGHLDAGASPGELLKILKRREAVEPLPVYARDGIVARLKRAPEPTVIPEPTELSSSDLPRVDLGAFAGTPPVTVSSVAPTAPAATPAQPTSPTQPTSTTPIAAQAVDPATRASAATAASVSFEEALSPSPVIVGDVLSERYHVVQEIGAGNISRLYKAIDSQRDTAIEAPPYVALKAFLKPCAEGSEEYAEFQREVLKLASLEHSNILKVWDCGRRGTLVYLVEEYSTGTSLAERIHGPMPPAATASNAAPARLSTVEARSLLDGVAAALRHAHWHDVVHGDLKPSNIHLSSDGTVKVMDFGLSRWAARPKSGVERREAAQNKSAVIAPRYASPQLIARQRPDPADDVYALASLTYELFTGRHPFDDGHGAPTMRFPPPSLPGLTSQQYAAVIRALQFDRRDRTQSVTEFLNDFDQPPPPRSWKKPVVWTLVVLTVVVVAVILSRHVGQNNAPSITIAPANSPESAPETEPAARAPSAVPTPAPPAPSAALRMQPGATLRDCPSCPSLTVIPTGGFKQGSAAEEKDTLPSERPQHFVLIGHPFAMSTNDVTVTEFRDFVLATKQDVRGCDTYDGEWRMHPKASWKDPGFPQTARHPVTCVSWKDAVAYAHWLSAKTGHQYRLPTASEWEYAARAGGDVARPWDSGASGACSLANVADQNAARRYPGWDVFACDDGYAHTAPVGSFKANGFGLNDIFGNVFQWTEDCWHEGYAGAPSDGAARMDGDCKEHELRGGSWFSSPAFVRAAYRNHYPSNYRTSSVGFRVVREIIP